MPSTQNNQENFKTSVVRGVLWSSLQSWGSRVLALVILILLARMLEPDDFGLIALASVYISFISIFVEQGFGDALVQYVDITSEHLDTAFWTSIFFSALLTLGTVVFADLIGALFREPQLSGIVQWLSLSFIFVALSSTQQAILRRELRFKELALRTMLAAAVGGFAGFGAAFAGYGVWSLVVQTLITSLTGTVVLWRVSDWRPGFRYSVAHFRALFEFGSNIIITNIANFFNRRLDDLLIGFTLGTTALGYYTIAYRLIQVLTQVFTAATTAVAFPAFSRMQHDAERLKRGFMQAISLTSLIAVPAFVGVSVLAPEIVLAVYGDQWRDSIPVMRVLPFIGIVHVILYFHSALLVARGKPNWRMGLALLHTVANVLFFAISVRWGIVAVASAYVLQGYLLFPVDLSVTQKVLPFSLRHYFGQLAVPVICSGLMAVVLITAKTQLSPAWTAQVSDLKMLIQLALYGAGGALVYLAGVALLDRKIFGQIRQLVQIAAK